MNNKTIHQSISHYPYRWMNLNALLLQLFRCHLLLADVHPDRLDAVASACRQVTTPSKISVQTSLCNVTDKSRVREAILAADRIANEASGCNASILVNCAGITRDAKVSNISDSDWEDVIGVNLKGTFHACQAFCETERVVSLLTAENGGGGSIVNMGSIVSKYGNLGQCNYSASKGGVVGLTRSLAKEMAVLSCKVNENNGEVRHCIPAMRVNCIQPGML